MSVKSHAGIFKDNIVGQFARMLHETDVFKHGDTRKMSDAEFEEFLCDEYRDWASGSPCKHVRENQSRDQVLRKVRSAIKACSHVWCPIQYTVRRGMWVRRDW